MRILVYLPSQYSGRPSGVAFTAFHVLANLLEMSGHEYALLSPWSRDDLPSALRNSRLETITLRRPWSMAAKVLADAARMPDWCAAHGIDVVLNADPFGTPAGGMRRVTVVHDLFFKDLASQFRKHQRWTNDRIMRRIIAASETMICVSDATRQSLLAHYPSAASKAYTIRSGPTFSPTDAIFPAPIDGPYVLTVGNATSNKNLVVLGQAFSSVRRTLPALRLVQVGADPRDALRGAMDERARRAVIALNNIDERTLRGCYAHAAALCVPSLAEGFCLPILEAQASDCPVVCSDRSAMPEIAGSGALLFDPRSVDALERALLQIIGSRPLRARLVRQGRANLARFDWRRTAESYLAALEGRLSSAAADGMEG